MLHNPDYLFSNSDRPGIFKFAVYNLKDPANGNGGAALANHNVVPIGSGAFTDYPSQAGYFFQFAGTTARVAFHPTDPPTGVISSWPARTNGFWDDLRATYQTCPSGYDRPSDGSTSAVTMGNATSPFRQSLWLNPQAYGVSSWTNSSASLYADGFFDRRTIVTPPAADASGQAVSYHATATTMNRLVAYDGVIYFNPTTYASIFFCTAGQRLTTNGSLVYGNRGFYMSSTIMNNNPYGPNWLQYTELGSSNSNFMAGGNSEWAGNIRCVQP
jgi:hypothetical protein